DLPQGHYPPHRAAYPDRAARRARRRLGDARRLRTDRGPARARRADPECVDLLPARCHLCRHHLHRLHRPRHGPDPAQDQRPPPGVAGTGGIMNTTKLARRAQFDHVSLSFDTAKGSLRVVDDVTYDINDGDFIAVIGPSGCGKTTMMSMLAG